MDMQHCAHHVFMLGSSGLICRKTWQRVRRHTTPRQKDFPSMWIVAVAWMYVVVMMSIAQAISPDGSVWGAIGILLFYGLLPVSLVMYVLFTPHRRRARRAQEAREQPMASTQDDAGGLTPSDPVSPKREEPPGV